MADVQIEAAAQTTLHQRNARLGPIWTDADTAYVFYVNAADDLVYRKTVNGGVDWAAAVNVYVGTITGASVWFDKWTPGDSGDLIHIAYSESDNHDVRYRNLNTSTDTLSEEKVVFDGVSAESSTWLYHILDITKARGGNLYCGFWIDNDGENGFYRSVDVGDNWAVRAVLADGIAADGILLLPGAEADSNDIWCIYWDRSADEISLKVHDNSEDSWDETSISGSISDNTGYYQMSAVQRASDNHVILAAWSAYNVATADLMVWDIGSAASIVAKTNVLTDSDDSAQVAVFINQQNDDIYVAYLRGAAWNLAVGAHYKKSEDGGGTWGGETGLSDDADDDLRAIWAGHSVGDEGGYFMPAWFDDDDNDLFTTTANAIAIAAAGGQTFYQSMAGTVTSAGAIARKTSISPSGTLSSAGALARSFQTAKALEGTVSSSGALVKEARVAFAGTLNMAGVLAAKTQKALSGSLSSAGAVRTKVGKLLGGTLSSSGALSTSKLILKGLAGILTSSGALGTIRTQVKALAGTLTSAGSLAKKATRSLAGVLPSAGSLATSFQTMKALAGTLTSSGAVTAKKLIIKSLAGTLASSGTLNRKTAITLGGTLTPSGSLLKKTTKVLAGVLATAGSLVHRLLGALTGVVHLTGKARTRWPTVGRARTKDRITGKAPPHEEEFTGKIDPG